MADSRKLKHGIIPIAALMSSSHENVRFDP